MQGEHSDSLNVPHEPCDIAILNLYRITGQSCDEMESTMAVLCTSCSTFFFSERPLICGPTMMIMEESLFGRDNEVFTSVVAFLSRCFAHVFQDPASHPEIRLIVTICRESFLSERFSKAVNQ
jgi:hypothetical protein